MNRFSETANFIWHVADLLRDDFKRGKYQDVILPLTVLRRIDCVLASTKPIVLETYDKLRGQLDNLDPQLRRASGYAFYNTSRYDFERLLDDPPNLGANLRNYINGFSDNLHEVLEKFNLDNTIRLLQDADLLFQVMERFRNIDLHPDRVSNLQMGYVFEELIRRFNEALNENPGEHFTPREVVRLMVDLLLAHDVGDLAQDGYVRTVYDPCCGTGGMLILAKDRIQEVNPQIRVYLFGQEVNPETFAVCKSDLYMKSVDGEDAERIKFGSTLSADQHAGQTFDYMLANPPYGKDWRRDEAYVKAEAERGLAGRFGAGLPRISDGQLLFLQHMLGRMNDREKGGSRVAIIMNGSPLFTGDAGSGESEIRRWILESDWLEAIVALPEQLFYNTGIATYVWVLSNRKEPARRGKVQLIDATDLWQSMRRSLGEKRREITGEQIAQITAVYRAFEASERSKIFATTDFGYRKITVERPLRLNFQASAERIARLDEESAFQNLAKSRKKQAGERTADEERGRQQQDLIRAVLATMPATLFTNRDEFEAALNRAIKGAKALDGPLFGRQSAHLKMTAPLRRALLAALSEQDESADICRDKDGNPEADPELRDSENVPLAEDVEAYFQREVAPYVPDAWINTAVRDQKDGEVGRVGYEISFNRYFYTYQPPRALEEIEREIRELEVQILELLKGVTG